MNTSLRWLTDLSSLLRGPAEALFDPSRRVFVPFVFVAGLIAVVSLALRGVSLRRALRGVLSPSVWWHPSARGDYKLIAARGALRLFSFSARGVSALAVAALTMSWLRLNLGRPSLGAHPLVVGALYTVAVFALEDLGRFWVHRLMHRVPALWEFHKVHHEAEVLTPLTLYRTHPVEGLINASSSALVVGLVTGVFCWCFGPRLHAWELFGVDALGFVWALAGSNLRHSHVWLSYGPAVERFFLSPAQHQVHHSAAPRHRDKNFGTAIALWDRLAGSLYVTTHAREALTFGLGENAPAPDHSVLAMLFAPIVRAARRLLPSRSPTPAPVAARPRARARAGGALAALVAVSAMNAGCTTERFDRVPLLTAFGRCTLATYDRFTVEAEALATATAAYAQAPDTARRDAARRAWERAIDVWQEAELLRYGPAADLNSIGGRGLREHIYAWPDVNRCLIDQRVVSEGYAGDAFQNLPTSARGLAAVEYLLFHEGSDNGCPATEAINAQGTWAALSPEELTRRRAAYASAAAAAVVTRARELEAAWEPDGFLQQLVSAGNGSTLFSTQQVAYSAVAEAAFYLDTDVKDLRLGRPLGITGCSTATCPEHVESQWADRGRRHLRNNLAGLRTLMLGCAAGNDQGFDDMLTAAGAGALATRVRADIAAAEAAIDALPSQSLRQSLADDRAAVLRVHTAVRAITDFLKMEFSATLQITSQRVEGDND